MNVQAEVSLYPLRTQELGPPINAFCDVLRERGLRVTMSSMSTAVQGDVADVFDGLKAAMAQAGANREVVLVAKVSNACPAASSSE